MRRLALFLVALGALGAAMPAAEAQQRRGRPLVLDVGPRSWLSPPPVVEPFSMRGEMSTYAFHQTFQTIPSAYYGKRDIYGEDRLPDRIGGGSGPFGPVPY